MKIRPVGVIASGQDPAASLQAVRDLDLECCQLSMPESSWLQAPQLAQLRRAIEETGVQIVGFFCHFPGESYVDIPTIQRTVGLVNPETRPERLRTVLQNSDDMAELGTTALLAHIGFIPEDQEHDDYKSIVDAVQQICERCHHNGQEFGLETGQETAPALLQFIQDVDRPNLKVNFDPANMLLYGSGRPLEALDLLRPYITSVHCKDGRWPTQPGQLGEEVPFGEGEVDVTVFLNRLKDTSFTGPLIIEREISGDAQKKDVARARDLIRSVLG